MKSIKTSLLGGCLLALSASAVNAGPAIVGTFVANPGKTDLVFKMDRCGKMKATVYSHRITLREDYTFEQTFELTGDGVDDLVLGGLWAEPRSGRIDFNFDGDLTEGASGLGSWGSLLTTAENNLKVGCEDISVKLTYATVRLQKMTLNVNNKGDQATLKGDIHSYAQGNNTRPGKASVLIKAPGSFEGSI